MKQRSESEISVEIVRALDLSRDFVALISSQAKILWVNTTLAERHGCKPSQLIGLNFNTIFDPNLKDLAEEVLITSVNEGRFHGELLMRGKNGSFHAFVSVTFIPPPDESSDKFTLLLNASDRTREKLMEEEIRKRREFLNAIISRSPIGIFCLDTQKRITVLNNALSLFLQSVGIDFKIGESLDNYASLINPQIDSLVEKGLSGSQVDLDNIPLLDGDHAKPVVSVICSPLITGIGEIEGLVILLEDRTEKLRMAEKMMEADRLASLGILAAGVAHEVNNPLTGIMGILGGLKDEATAKGIDSEPFDRIQSNLVRIRDIVKSLLDFSRKKISVIKEIEINELVRKTYSFFKMQPKFKYLDIGIELKEGIPIFRGDPGHIEHVLQNLIINASQAVSENGTIVVSTDFDPVAREIIIRVDDNGCGIPVDDLDKIFEPFFTTKSPDQGTGLGLAVSYSLARQHGGTIVVEKTSEDGSIFAVRLPV